MARKVTSPFKGKRGAGRGICLLIECFNALLVGSAVFDLLAPHRGAGLALLAAAACTAVVGAQSWLTIVQQEPLRMMINRFSQRYGDNAMDAVFLLYAPAGIAVLAQSAAAFSLLRMPTPPTLLYAWAWGFCQLLILAPVVACYHPTRPRRTMRVGNNGYKKV